MSRGGKTAAVRQEKGGIHFCIFQKQMRRALRWGCIQTVKQSLLSMALKYIHVVDRHITNMILKEIASHAFNLVIIQSRLFCGIDFRRNNLGMGKFVEALILISRDNIRVLSTKAQLF